MDKILIVLDGAADLADKNLGGKTPLESANMPNLDFFAKNSRLGLMNPISEEITPGSDNALVSIFGNDYKISKRGVFEAFGAGLKLNKNFLAFRVNFGTIENLKNRKVIDRRGGRTITTKESRLFAKALNEKLNIGCRVELIPTVQHRGVVVFYGNFSDNISNVDPEWSLSGNNEYFEYCHALDDTMKSKKSADIVNEFLNQAFRILSNHPLNLKRIENGLLPANFLFLRGAGNKKIKLKKYNDWISINSMPLEIGISKLSGMKVFSFPYPELRGIDSYENLYEGLNKTIDFAIKTIKKEYKKCKGCYIQIKETDIPGHDNKPFEKKKMLEIVDKKLFGFLRKFFNGKDVKIAVTCDHSTPCALRAHSHHPVPVLVFDGKNKDNCSYFSENESRTGSLGTFSGRDFMNVSGFS